MSLSQQFIEYSIIGIAAGGVYALIALGIILIFKSSRTFNFATGEMMMLSAYFFYAASVTFALGPALGMIVALAGSIVVALLIERVAIRPMIGRPFIAVVMVTFGIGSVIRGLVGLFWGPNDLQIPAILSRSPIMLGGIFVPGKTARAFAIAVVALYYIVFTASVYSAVPWDYIYRISLVQDVSAPALLAPLLPLADQAVSARIRARSGSTAVAT